MQEEDSDFGEGTERITRSQSTKSKVGDGKGCCAMCSDFLTCSHAFEILNCTLNSKLLAH